MGFAKKRILEGLWDEWLNLNLFLITGKMQLDEIIGKEVFNILPKEKQSELIGRKEDFAKKRLEWLCV